MTTPETDAARPEPMAKAYDPRATEDRVYHFWESRGYFKPRPDADGEPFCIIMPPPNVTGELHIGHALTDTVEDILIRWHRMLGDPALWVPGVDHAGIATQNVVEKQLAKEGLSRHDLGRDEFEKRVWQWVGRYRPIISNQHRRLGASADWSSEVFTLDDGPQRAVRTTFKKMWDDGLIYRGHRLINWGPRCQTAVSDLEVDHEEQQGSLWYIQYPVVDGHDEHGHPRLTGEHLTVATTRPETYVGDVAVAVNPRDERYTSWVGRTIMLPVIQREIPVLAEDAIEMEFGTGAVKVTPGHDPTDFEIGQRHNLPIINVMNKDATMNEEAGPYVGVDRYEARATIRPSSRSAATTAERASSRSSPANGPGAVITPRSSMIVRLGRSCRRPISKSFGSCAGVTFTAPVPNAGSTCVSATMGISRPTSGSVTDLPTRAV
jgi:valyl-tRNA synthetase